MTCASLRALGSLTSRCRSGSSSWTTYPRQRPARFRSSSFEDGSLRSSGSSAIGVALRVHDAPPGVVALGVAGLAIGVKEIERQAFVGDLQCAIGPGDRSELTRDAIAARRRLACRNR